MAHGIRSTRFFAHHAGLAGNISNHLKWKGMATYIKHFGTFKKPYKKPVEQVSGLLELLYSNHAFPVEIGLAAAADTGTSFRRNRGISLTLSKKW